MKKNEKKKKDKFLHIEIGKACRVGLFQSLLVSILCSFGGSMGIIDSGIFDKKIPVMTLFWIFMPVLFVFLGLFVLGFIVVCSGENKNK